MKMVSSRRARRGNDHRQRRRCRLGVVAFTLILLAIDCAFLQDMTPQHGEAWMGQGQRFAASNTLVQLRLGRTASQARSIKSDDTEAELRLLKRADEDTTTASELSILDNRSVVNLAARHREPDSNLTTAVCFKTLFGDIDLGIVLQWIAYHRLLGFDHMFLWYRPEMVEAPHFAELQALPFVTLTVNTRGNRADYYFQKQLEIQCLSSKKFARSFDWVLVFDTDEYLWFDRTMGVKDFLRPYEYQNIAYISFGKFMYTLDHRVSSVLARDPETWQVINQALDTTGPDWAVASYPYYLPGYCRARRGPYAKGSLYCPTRQGKCKVMVKPNVHQRVNLHGTIARPDVTTGSIHIDGKVAHLKEWPNSFDTHTVTTEEDSVMSLVVTDNSEVSLHVDVDATTGLKRPLMYEAFQTTAVNGTDTYTFLRDDTLREWFAYVKSRAIIDGDVESRILTT